MSPCIARHIGPDRLPYVPVRSCFHGDPGEEIDVRGEIKGRMLGGGREDRFVIKQSQSSDARLKLFGDDAAVLCGSFCWFEKYLLYEMIPNPTTSQLKQRCRFQFLIPGALIQGLNLHNSAWQHLLTSLISQTEMSFF